MKNRTLFFLGCLVWLSGVVYAQENATTKQYAQLITKEDLKENLSIIASDALEGRYTGSRGQKMAAAFISHYFGELGLQAPVNGSHYMPVELFSTKPMDIYMKAGGVDYRNYEQVVYLGQADSGGEVSAEVVFAGLGREEDYAYVDVKDKLAVVLIEKLSVDNIGEFRRLSARAREKGARMMILVSTGKEDEFKPVASQLKSWLEEGGLTLQDPKTNLNRGYFLADQAVANKIFSTPIDKLLKVAKESASKKPLQKIKKGTAQYQVSMNTKIIRSENVLGYLPGTDKKDELVIISAHFDHIGKEQGSEGDVINNGADDDGSGTVGVLQLAKAFAQAKKEGRGPRRSILFMTVTGEEEGLFGSQYYVEHPVFPLSSTVVDLNIDMIGRWDPQHAGKKDYVYVIGSDKLSSELHEINERNNKTYTQLDFDYTYNDENHPDNLYRRSDHWNFAKNNIPIVFYFDGIHEDYHRVSDEVSKIDFDLLAKRTRLVFFTAWEIANRDTRLKVDK